MTSARPFVQILRRQFTLLAVVPVLVVGGMLMWYFDRTLRESTTTHQQALAKTIAQETDRQIQSAREQVDVLAASSSGLANGALDDFLRWSPYFETVYVADRQGLIESIGLRRRAQATRELYLGIDVANSELMRDVSGESSPWTGAFLSAVTGRLSIAYLRDIGSRRILAEMTIDRLPRLSRELSGQNQLVVILDHEANVLGHPDPVFSQQQVNLGNLPFFESDADIPLRSAFFEFEGQSFYGTAVQMDSPGWVILVAQDDDIFFAPLRVSIRFLAAAMIAVILVSLVVARARARRLEGQVAELTDLAKQVTAGDYSQNPFESDAVEFNQLALDFRSMASAIQAREADLEQRVANRTSELETVNAELRSTLESLRDTMDQLVQSEKLASLGSLVAGIAHELNTPIGNALMASSSLTDFAKDFRRQYETGQIRKSTLESFLLDAEESTRISQRNLERAAELISSFKQVAVDQSSSQRRRFDLERLINEVILTMSPILKRTNVVVEVKVAEVIELDGFPGPLGQVLSNLITNAVVHGLECAEEPKVSVAAVIAGDRAKLTISDNGVGMDEGTLRHLFDPFFTTRLGRGGSGLGMHIVHSIVTEMLKGAIEVHSKPDLGTRFDIELPLVVGSSREKVSHTEQAPIANTSINV